MWTWTLLLSSTSLASQPVSARRAAKYLCAVLAALELPLPSALGDLTDRAYRLAQIVADPGWATMSAPALKPATEGFADRAAALLPEVFAALGAHRDQIVGVGPLDSVLFASVDANHRREDPSLLFRLVGGRHQMVGGRRRFALLMNHAAGLDLYERLNTGRAGLDIALVPAPDNVTDDLLDTALVLWEPRAGVGARTALASAALL